MTAPETIHNLVSRFRDSRELLNSAHYNETQLRIEFLNPLFIELGWDVYNERNIALQYRDVIHEDSLEIEGTTRAPDYAFCVGTSRKFFVEAKKPSARIVTNAEAAYQLRRYAWNAKLPLSILTDFEHFAVYDCRNRPDPKDSAATGRVLLYNFEEYLSHWDEIAKIFSKQAVWSGAFDKFADGTKGKRGTTEVDAEFLKEIEAWRDLLARNIALRNFRSSEELANLPRAERQLNYAVQATIDRLLFLRISEDREIEPPEQLLQLSRQPDIYANLIKLFKHADQKYNSGLFHFLEEKSQTSAPDTFTPTLQIDDKVLRQIIESLYYPCPYIFKEIPVEILGQVYEQFLGKVIRLTPKGIAKVEEKPEVRKAGGVYYTPSYIVDYIVHNTLSPLLHPDQPSSDLSSRDPQGRGDLPLQPSANQTPDNQLESSSQTPSSEAQGLLASWVKFPGGGIKGAACVLGSVPRSGSFDLSSRGSQFGDRGDLPFQPSSDQGTMSQPLVSPDQTASLTPDQALKLRVVDPACGSGSFLLGAYQYLLDWHLNYYLTHDPESHIRGKNPPIVATEGGEYRLTTEEKKRILTASIYGVDIDAQAVEVTKLSLLLKLLEGETGQLTLGFDRVLPDLGNNIRCGNSLIGWDYFASQLLPDEEEIIRVNPFDWQRSFPEVFAQGGFDAVIGNPPYIRIQSIREWAPRDVDHYKRIYKSAQKGNFDIYVIFIEQALSLLDQEGRLGFILPHKFFQAEFASPIREIISRGKHLQKIVHFGAEQVFANATTYTCLLFLNKSPQDAFQYSTVSSLQAIDAVFDAMEKSEPHPDYESALLPAPEAGGKEWEFFANEAGLVLQKLRQQPKTLGDVTKKIFQGIATSADKVYVLRKIEEREKTILLYSKALEKEVEIEKGFLKPFLMGKDVHRYDPLPTDTYIIFPYFVTENDFRLLEPSEIKENYPRGWEYLLENKDTLSKRERGRYQGKYFYAFSRPQNMTEYTKPKILTPEISYGTNMTLDREGAFYHTTKVYSFVFKENQKEAPEYWLGLLNSKVLWFFIKNTGYTLRGGYFTFKTNYLSPFPIPTIDFNNPDMVEKHDRIVELVKTMLTIKADKHIYRSSLFDERLFFLEKQIEDIIFEIYGIPRNWEKIF